MTGGKMAIQFGGSTSPAPLEGKDDRRDRGDAEPRLRHDRRQRGPVFWSYGGTRRAQSEVRRQAVEVGQVDDGVVVEIALRPDLSAGAEVGGEAVEVLQVDRAVEVRVAEECESQQQ